MPASFHATIMNGEGPDRIAVGALAVGAPRAV